MSFEKMYVFTRLSRVEPRAKIRGWSRGRTPHPVPPGTKKLRSAVLKWESWLWTCLGADSSGSHLLYRADVNSLLIVSFSMIKLYSSILHTIFILLFRLIWGHLYRHWGPPPWSDPSLASQSIPHPETFLFKQSVQMHRYNHKGDPMSHTKSRIIARAYKKIPLHIEKDILHGT